MHSVIAHADALLAFVYLAIVGLVVYAATGPLSDANFWASYTQDPGPWCERDRSRAFVREPSNAFTDFSFLAAGICMIACAARDLKHLRSHGLESQQANPLGGTTQASSVNKARPLNLIRANPILSVVFGVINIVHAVGTFTNHSCRCLEGHILDVAGMYSVIYLFLCLSALKYIHGAVVLAAKEKPLTLSDATLPDRAIAAFLLCLAAGVFGLYQISQLPYSDARTAPRETLTVASMVIVALILHAAYAHAVRSRIASQPRLIVIAVLLLIAAFGLHQMDIARILCNPDSLFQGHAAWHVMTCGSLSLVYSYHRNERWRTSETSQ
ncbi:hypothetical protein CAOG_01062 [Capsaspora owczarzaki ATCC 30864]|uniref:Ceramidase n=1 Tax=Capsaspora owczarzaki (strain ATCC 30864) TaxID=595528 RepID=A0A0D2U389_CAPO3|nr:hypothetical protein CAOG_01062 [Capsaspora owczarzaki ATCC 30864]KJE89626.1 hypothetical protein CAOG_001062 [Capsaspora owczarzaki ATCC 30864]|eukprot:XP_004365933.1 hypothetical protein CAOG_01062 [Capsaspora owczarzaki ATCC 30864]